MSSAGRANPAIEATRQDHKESGRGNVLTDDRRPGGTLNTHPERVDEQVIQHNIQESPAHSNDHRCPRVLSAAQPAVPHLGNQERAGREHTDAEIGLREVLDIGAGAEQPYDRSREDHSEESHNHPENARHEQGLDSDASRVSVVVGSDEAGNPRCNAVREEAEEPERGRKSRGPYRDGPELLGAEVADEGGIGQRVERVCRQGAESGYPQCQNRPVGGVPPGQQPSPLCARGVSRRHATRVLGR